VNHPYLVIYSPTSSSAAEHAQKALDAKAAAGLCPLCHDPFEVGLHVPVSTPHSVRLATCESQSHALPSNMTPPACAAALRSTAGILLGQLFPIIVARITGPGVGGVRARLLPRLHRRVHGERGGRRQVPVLLGAAHHQLLGDHDGALALTRCTFSSRTLRAIVNPSTCTTELLRHVCWLKMLN